MEHTPNGILLVDKAAGWTSHDVVARARRGLGTRKVGHAGTLDPMATGLLMLGAGPATRLLTHMVGLDKTYETTIRLGISTVTDDREGEVLDVAAAADIDALAADTARISAAIAELTGDIEQAPSAVSAIKVDGRRAYDRVREGEHVELKKRPVTIHTFESSSPRRELAPEGPVLDIDAVVRCSSGTYIRALARDLGAVLGVGGHLTALRRTHVGPFSVDAAISHEALADAAPATLRPIAAVEIAKQLFPVLSLTQQQTTDLGHGKRFDVDAAQCADAPLVAAISPDNRLIGIVSVTRGRVRVVTNFPTEMGGAGL